MNNPLMHTTAALVLSITWVISVQQIAYAKSLPGEGFTAGALMLLPILLVFLVRGEDEASQQMPVRLFYRGLLVGASTLVALAFGPLLQGKNLLSAMKLQLGPVELSSTLLFDLALFLVTVCSLVLAVNSLRKELP